MHLRPRGTPHSGPGYGLKKNAASASATIAAMRISAVIEKEVVRFLKSGMADPRRGAPAHMPG